MPANTRIIILAAGIGSRLRPLTEHLPKCCVPVDGEPLVKRIVRQLQDHDASLDITVVAGYLAHQVAEQFPIESGVKILVNDRYSSTNNMESCRLALQANPEFSGSTVIINGDCAYDTPIVHLMLKQKAEQSCIAVDSSQYHEESMKVHIENGYITDIRKTLPDTPENLTSIDFYHFCPNDTQHLLNIMQGYRLMEETNFWNEVAIQDFVRDNPERVSPLDIRGLHWVEIDNHDDLAKAEILWNSRK